MTSAFVTGGSGFVGGALISDLVASESRVRALVRSSSAAERVAARGAAPIEGSLFDRAGLPRLMDGSTVVFHVAGVNELCPADPAELIRVNVDGARAVVEAAAAANVPRVVLTSSVVTVPARTQPLSTYERSKRLGEEAAFAAGRRTGVDVVAVNPSSVQGPGRLTGSARLFLYLLRRKRPIVPDTIVSLVDVDDCATAHRLAWHNGRPGERYVISAGWVGAREAGAILARATGREIRPLVVPRSIVRVVAGVPARIGDRRPGATLLCSEALRTVLENHVHDGSAAASALGFRYRSVDEIVTRAADWYRAEGLI